MPEIHDFFVVFFMHQLRNFKLWSDCKYDFFLFKDIDPNEKISEESEGAFVDLVLKLIDCQKVSIELAIMLGKSFVKIYLMKKPLEFEEWILDLIESRKTSFGKLCLVTGSLNHGPNNAQFHDRLFGYVMTCCSSTTSHDFQSFQALKIWSSKLKLSRSEVLMEEKSDRLQSLLNLINSNWGSSLKANIRKPLVLWSSPWYKWPEVISRFFWKLAFCYGKQWKVYLFTKRSSNQGVD